MPKVTRPKSTKAPAKKPTKGAVDACLGYIARELETAKANNGGRSPYGALKKLVDDNVVAFPWLNVMQVKNHLRKLTVPKTNESTLTALEAEIAFTMAGMSSLTGPEMREHPPSIIVFQSNPGTALTSTANSNSASEGTTIALLNSASEVSTQNLTTEQIVDNGYGGRPKGTTAAHSVDLSQKIALVKEEAAALYILVRSKAKKSNTRTPKGELTSIIEQSRARHSIPADIQILHSTIRSRAKRGVAKARKGHLSPMLEVEEYIVQIASQLAKMRAPISRREGLELANSLIHGTDVGVTAR